MLLSACRADQQRAQVKATSKDSSAALAAATKVSVASTVIGVDTANRTLATATGSHYRVDNTVTNFGTLSVQVSSTKPLPPDTTIKPDRDATKCKPFLDATFPPRRGAKTNGVGNAIAWLVGVESGPRDESLKRVNIRLEKCQLQPRVQRVPQGATIIANNRDASPSDLRFVDVGQASPRSVLHFTEPGQVVPSADVLTKAGLVQVLDARHPWLRAFIAIAPNPYVAVTSADGKFVWENVPAGNYQLVVWHERLGARVMPVVVKEGQKVELRVDY